MTSTGVIHNRYLLLTDTHDHHRASAGNGGSAAKAPDVPGDSRHYPSRLILTFHRHRSAMRFVPIKTPEQQSGLMLHRTRHLFIRQQTAVINAIRAHLAEFGITAAVGRKGIEELLRVIADPSDKRVPDVVRAFRERSELISERVGLTNRIGAVLATATASPTSPAR
jgi:transposase